VIALSGQSRGAGPGDVIVKGHLDRTMDAIAAHHGGRAPIVVVPDQLGPGSPNPMCVDSKLGDAATYITVDVRRWVLRHLPTFSDRRDWTIAGFSEGGTCAIQFGAGDPRLFGSIVDVSGEVAPRNGTIAHTIAVGFAGSRAAYDRATPFALLQRSAPFPPTRAEFAAGALDRRYGPVAPVMARQASRAGMRVEVELLPHARHNWSMATPALAWGLNRLVGWWNLDRPSSSS
jgi:S-formylglutathione hydrolase FrmB